MICWFFGAAILGDLSDTAGRKSAVGLFNRLVFGLFIISFCCRHPQPNVLNSWSSNRGIYDGQPAQPISQAAIVDVSSETHKMRNISLILLAILFGFIIGPIIGSVLSDSRFVSWFRFARPLYFAWLISLINAFIRMPV